jgi:hypothetical protein
VAKSLAYSFVFEELQSRLSVDRIRVNPMFGSHALYVDDKIVFILRRKDDPNTARDNGVWVAMPPERVDSVARQFPAMRPIEMFQTAGRTGFSGWLNLPESEDGFEESAFELCRLIASGDPRIGKFPKPKSKARKSSKRR